MSVLGSCSTAFCLLTMATLGQLVTTQPKNVALGKPAESSPLWEPSLPPGVAVDGVTDNDTQCVETAPNDRDPYWRVDLSHKYTISNIILYRRAQWSRRMVGVKIYVDSELCHIITYDEAYTPPPSPGPPVAISVQCSTPLTGRHLTLVKNYTGDISVFHSEILSICEVQVWASSQSSLSTSTPTLVTTTSTTTTATTLTSTTSTPTTIQHSVPPSSVTQPVTTITTPTTATQTATTIPGDNTASTSVSGDQSAPPTESATTSGVVGGVLGSLLLLSLTVIVVLVVRRQRCREQNRGDNRQPDGGDIDTAGTGQINTATLPSVAKGTDHKETSAGGAQDDYDVIGDSGHYYDPLSYRDNNYVNDNTLYTSPVFTSSNNDSNDKNDSGGNGADIHLYTNDVK